MSPASQSLSLQCRQDSQLQLYVKELVKYNEKINLIAQSTVDLIWQRHIEDCAQLKDHIDPARFRTIADLGSGAGLPGIVLAILMPDIQLMLIEKSFRKAQFLTHVVSTLKLTNVSVLNYNITQPDQMGEGVKVSVGAAGRGAVRAAIRAALRADLVVSRAFKKTAEILEIVETGKIITKNLLLLKGQTWPQEVNEAKLIYKDKWTFSATPSVCEPKAAVVALSQI